MTALQKTRTNGPVLIHTEHELHDLEQRPPVAAVFTMGALHEGHAHLIDEARKYVDQSGDVAGTVIVSVFVNPTQFEKSEDLANYPRTISSDLEVCAKSDADIVFVPSVSEIYPEGVLPIEKVAAGQLGDIFEGASRPGHFDAVLTVVNRLIQITKPDAVFFGEKDFQQLVLVRQMVRELNLPVEVIGVPTVRDSTGLALSSRNEQLDSSARKVASCLHESLIMAQQGISEGKASTEVKTECAEYLRANTEIDLDYFEIVNEDLHPPKPGDKLRALVAAKIGGVRLIDNISLNR